LNGGLGSETQFWKGITQGPSQHTFVVWFHLGVNATFNNISAISWHSALFGGYRSTRRKRPTCHKSLTNFITSIYIKYILPWVGFKLITSVVIVTDCIGSCTFVNPNKNYDCKHSEQEQNKLRDINYNKWKDHYSIHSTTWMCPCATANGHYFLRWTKNMASALVARFHWQSINLIFKRM
jgi:hypothetical protein